MSEPAHVSSFELDVYFASGEDEGDREGATARHVAECARCRAYLEGLEALSALPPPARTRRRLWIPAVATLALAAGIALFVSRERSRTEELNYVGTKGSPAAQILIRSAGQVRVWDGASPVRPGDALAVHVACEEFSYVTVATESVARPWEGPCATTPSTLPFTLVVDDQPGREHFNVVLSRARLTDEGLRAAIVGETRGRNVWTISFDFVKEGSR
jgi:hypothetical protein